MRVTLFLLILLTSQTLRAQRWSASLTFAPGICGQWGSNTDSVNVSDLGFKKHRSSFEGGVTFTKNKRVSFFQTGVWYNRKSFSSGIWTSKDSTFRERISAVKTLFYQDIEIPFIYKWKIPLGKTVVVAPGIGAVIGFNLKQYEKLESEKGEKIEQIKKGFDLSPDRVNIWLSVTSYIKLSDRYFIAVEPYFKPDLTELFISNTFDSSNYTIGLATAIGINLKSNK